MRRLIRWITRQERIDSLEAGLEQALRLVEDAYHEGGQAKGWERSVAREERLLLGLPGPASVGQEVRVHPLRGVLGRPPG